jgi:50S ribosomal subunit-associated GTPase HflX
VLDVSDPACDIQYNTVQRVLDDLMDEIAKSPHAEDKAWTPPKRVLLLNKADQLADNRELLVWQQKVPGSIPLCALPSPPGKPPCWHAGQQAITDLVRETMQGGIETFDVVVPLADAKTINMIERQGEILAREYAMDASPPTVRLRAKIGRRQLAQLRSAGARLAATTQKGGAVDLTFRPDPDARATWGR